MKAWITQRLYHKSLRQERFLGEVTWIAVERDQRKVIRRKYNCMYIPDILGRYTFASELTHFKRYNFLAIIINNLDKHCSIQQNSSILHKRNIEYSELFSVLKASIFWIVSLLKQRNDMNIYLNISFDLIEIITSCD